MTCILSMAFPDGAVLAADTRTVDANGVRSEKSKLFRDPERPRWLSHAGIHQLGDYLLPLICDGVEPKHLPLAVDGWLQEAGRGETLATADLTDTEREMIAAPMHCIECAPDGAFQALGIAPTTGEVFVKRAGAGLWVSWPYLSSPEENAEITQRVFDEIRACPPAGAFAGIVKAVAHYFVDTAARYGGPDGWMNDQVEFGLCWRTDAGRVVRLHRPPGPAADVLTMTDADLLHSITLELGTVRVPRQEA